MPVLHSLVSLILLLSWLIGVSQLGLPVGLFDASLLASDFCSAWLQAVLCLSPEQVTDLMFLRRVFFLRRQELAVQRAKLTQQMQDESASTLAHATRVKDVASDLQQIAAADHQNFHRFAWATYFGVGLCIHQHLPYS